MSTEEMPKKESFVKGLTWGSYTLSEDKLRFNGESKKWFDIPLKALSNVQQGGNKNEIALEFNKDEDIEDSAICEIKLFVPEIDNKKKEAEEKDENKENQEQEKDENKENQEQEKDVEEEKPYKMRVELLKEEIMKIAGIGSVTGAIAHIPDFQTIIPRGKFDIFFLKNAFKMNGQSHNYQIQTKNIAKLFLVQKAEGNYSLLILKLKSPLTQGNVSYPFIIYQIKAESEISIDLQIPEDDEDLNNVEDFQSPLSGNTIDVISKLFHKIMNKGLIIPSKTTLFSKGPFIKCSYKANDGVLYFFEKSLLFVQKPVLEIEHDAIKEVDIARIQASSMQQRTFDITIKLKKDSYQFSGIEIAEIDILQKYMNDKKLNLKMKDEDNNNIEIMKYTSTRRRAPVSDELPNLPSEEELGEGDYSDSGEDNDDYQDDEDDEDEEEEEEDKKEKKKNKNKKKKVD
jgi:structure-specific recognition protein 1